MAALATILDLPMAINQVGMIMLGVSLLVGQVHSIVLAMVMASEVTVVDLEMDSA